MKEVTIGDVFDRLSGRLKDLLFRQLTKAVKGDYYFDEVHWTNDIKRLGMANLSRSEVMDLPLKKFNGFPFRSLLRFRGLGSQTVLELQSILVDFGYTLDLPPAYRKKVVSDVFMECPNCKTRYQKIVQEEENEKT